MCWHSHEINNLGMHIMFDERNRLCCMVKKTRIHLRNFDNEAKSSVMISQAFITNKRGR